MRKFKLQMFFTSLLILTAGLLNAQMYGKWVIPAYSSGETNSTSYQLTFSENGIIEDELGLLWIPDQENVHLFSGGAFNRNYELDFYVVDNIITGTIGNQYTYTSGNISFPEFQIIPLSNTTNRYIVIYSRVEQHDYNSTRYFFVNINEDTGEIEVETPELNEIQDFDDSYGAFAVSEEINEARYVYHVSKGKDALPHSGLFRILIDASGISNITSLFGSSNTNLSRDDFDAYNMEMKTSEGTNVFAWIHGTFSDYTNQNVDEIVVINGYSDQIFDLNLGRIGGIEFSHFEENIIYASCTERGIVKLNYVTGTVSDVYAPATPDYSRTFLQTAPDGHIYAVSNDGMKLGRILQHGNNAGTFQPAVYQFPYYRSIATFKNFDDLKYYILPENERIHTPLEVIVLTEPESCPDYYDGRAEIFVSGGVPFDDEDAPYIITSTPTANWQWDVDDFYFYTHDLTADTYTFTITDNATPEPNILTGTFVIELDNSHFSFPDTYFEVTSDKSLPDTEYSENFYTFEKGIRISNGATLTINNSEYEFGPDASIIIEPGAKLIVNNTILTNSKYCAPDFKLWKGIQVRGNSDESQLPEYIDQQWVYHQGRLKLQDAVISFAETAISVAKRNAAGEIDWSSGGGIVVAQGSQFINNPAAVAFIPYRAANLSHFTDCSFSLNKDYISGNTFFKHIDLNQINDVRFRSCSFSVMQLPDVSPYNQGIAAYSSSFRVLPDCEPETIPCPDENLLPSLFTGFYRAVGVYNDGLRKTTHFEVDNTLFISNSTGIYATNTDGAVMTDNTFEIGYNNTDCEKCGKSGALGIDLLTSVNFVIENNGFSRHSAAQPGDYVGIRVTNCPSVDDDIYRNQFNGLSVGNMAVGVNRRTSSNDATGVSYQCNENVLNDIDFWVKDFSAQSQIRGNVGEQLLASGNTLTDPAFATIQFLNDYTQDIRYYYYQLNPIEELSEYSAYVYPYPINTTNPCLPQYGSGGGGISLSDAEKTELELEYADGLADYNSVETLYNSLLDDGNTQAEIASLQAATPADMWTLRSKLLGTSPHLSDEVLKQMADRADVFPDAVQFEVLASNPEELRKEELMSYLEQKSDPLPKYMLEILRQVASGSSYKSVLQSQMSFYQEKYVKSAQRIIRSLLFDSITDYNQLRQWYDNIGGYQMDLQIVNTWIAEGAYDVALDFAEVLPAMHQLEGDQLAAHEEYMSLLEMSVDLEQQNRNIRQLTAQELVMISTLAQTASPHAQSKARAMLEYAYGEHYFECPDVPESVVLKSTKPISAHKLADAMGLQLKAEPNPAADWAQFSWQLPGDAGHAILEIYDGMGRLLQSIQLQGNQGAHLLDTRKLPAGIYSCVLKTAGMQKTVKLVIH